MIGKLGECLLIIQMLPHSECSDFGPSQADEKDCLTLRITTRKEQVMLFKLQGNPETMHAHISCALQNSRHNRCHTRKVIWLDTASQNTSIGACLEHQQERHLITTFIFAGHSITDSVTSCRRIVGIRCQCRRGLIDQLYCIYYLIDK